MSTRLHRGPELPYKLLAGAEPCHGGWLVMRGNLQGVQLAPQPPEVFPTFQDIIDWKPAFSVIAVHAPLGLPKRVTVGGRTCDREARALLGWPRSGAITSAPVRRALKAKSFAAAAKANNGMNPVVFAHLRHYAEVDKEMEPYWQRTIFEVHPELSFYNINKDRPLKHAKETKQGVAERKRVLKARFPGVERVYGIEVEGATPVQVLDACAILWTARRLAARAATRIPQEPEWDAKGLRMEVWR